MNTEGMDPEGMDPEGMTTEAGKAGTANAEARRAAVRIGVFAAGVLAVFGIAFGVGTAIGPWDVDTTPSHGEHQTTHTVRPGQSGPGEQGVSHDGH